MIKAKSKIALVGNYLPFEESVIIDLFASEPVSFADIAGFIHEQCITANITDFVGKHGVKNVVVNFKNHENNMYTYKSSRNWASEENVKKDLAEQVLI